MKKIISFTVLLFLSFSLFAKSFYFDAGIGSGFVFYGDEDLKSALSNFDNNRQMIVSFDSSINFPLADEIQLSFGGTSIIDSRWKDSQSIILCDYAIFTGFNVFPTNSGFLFSINYCLGRRTDFFNFDYDSFSKNTNWGNGFFLEAAYNFGYPDFNFAPEITLSWRRMPRGGSADNILELKFRLNF